MSLDWVLLPARPQAALPALPFHVWTLRDGVRWTEFHRAGDAYLLRFPDLADFTVSADGRLAECHPCPGISDDTSRHLFLNQVAPLALSRQGRLMFHGSAVQVGPDAAIAFIGESGRGKSTLAASFAVQGARFLTDDGLEIAWQDGQHRIIPGHPSLRIWQDTQQALSIGPGSGQAVHYSSKLRFHARDDMAHCESPLRLRGAYFLGEGTATDISIVPLTPAEALVEWVRHTFLLDLEEAATLARHFDSAIRLAQQPLHYRLDYPRRYDLLEGVREALLAHAAGQPA